MHARAAEQKLQISHEVTMQERARCNIEPEKVKCTNIYLTKHCLFVSETVSMMQIYYSAGSLVGQYRDVRKRMLSSTICLTYAKSYTIVVKLMFNSSNC